jgi:acyl-CoA thioesterase I
MLNSATMKTKSLVVVVCLIFVLLGCGDSSTIGRLTEDSVVLAFGDSLTAGTGAPTNNNYPAVLAGVLGCQVVNAGIPGEQASEGRRRLPGVLKEHRPDLVILCHGGNDFLAKRDDPKTAADLAAMITAVEATGADILLVGVPKPGLRLKAPSFYRDLAKKHRIPCDAETVADILSTPSLKSDQIHPNAAGYGRLAEAIAMLIRESQVE